MPTENYILLFAETLEENFSKRMEKKTGWGKNEIMQEFQRAVAQTSLELVFKLGGEQQ